jgi:hypothetical protein
MEEEDKGPEIIQKIVEFFNFWNNPDELEDEYVPIKAHQLEIYSVSYDFVFKWYVTEEELKEVSEFTGFKINDDMIALSIGEHNLELAVRGKNLTEK